MTGSPAPSLSIHQPVPAADEFVSELDAAVEAHMNWTRRILRCSLLRASPGADVLSEQAHALCHFGGWFEANSAAFAALDPAATARVKDVHRDMHDAIRTICTAVMEGRAAREPDVDGFEHAQSELLGLLAVLKTRYLSHTLLLDTLTGLPTRREIANDFALLQKEAGRLRTLLYVALIDIDRFKSINDTHGHPVGDQVLRQLATTLRSIIRGGEPVYRYGGEEFLWLLRCGSDEDAKRSAERILKAVRETRLAISPTEALALSVTIGLALAGPEEPLEHVIQRADLALYEGKRGGRDRWVLAA